MELDNILAYEPKARPKNKPIDPKEELVELKPSMGKPFKLVIHRDAKGAVKSMEIIMKLANDGDITSLNDNSYFIFELKKSDEKEYKDGYFVSAYCFDTSSEKSEEYGYLNDPKKRKIEVKKLPRDVSKEAFAKIFASIFVILGDKDKKNELKKETAAMLKIARYEIEERDDNKENLDVIGPTEEFTLPAQDGREAKVTIKREFDGQGRLIKNITFELCLFCGKTFIYKALDNGNNASVFLKEVKGAGKEYGLFKLNTHFTAKELTELKLILAKMLFSASKDELDTRVLLNNIIKKVNDKALR